MQAFGAGLLARDYYQSRFGPIEWVVLVEEDGKAQLQQWLDLGIASRSEVSDQACGIFSGKELC